ncbi:MAG: hypothetical protein GC190_08450 [Alphaproteobacteria bacterium]|nr:hypothetical protein [Alphaproteobacteria bacterium]
MQPTIPPISLPSIGRTDRPPVTPLSQLVAKVLSAPTTPPVSKAEEPQATPVKEQPPARTDGRDIRLGSVIDIRV